jgi:hypothetical protein
MNQLGPFFPHLATWIEFKYIGFNSNSIGFEFNLVEKNEIQINAKTIYIYICDCGVEINKYLKRHRFEKNSFPFFFT